MAAGPLAGRRVLVTRSRSQAPELIRRIEALGGEVYAFEAAALAEPADWGPADAAIRQLGRFDWVAFTSANGVHRFLTRVERVLGVKPAAALGHARIAVVGPGTAAELVRHGLQADLMPSRYRGEELGEELARRAGPGARVLVVRPEQPAVDLTGLLSARGCQAADCVVYRVTAGNGDPAALRAALAAGRIDYATFASGAAVERLLTAIGGPALLSGVKVAVIGPQTAAAARAAGLPVDIVAPEATMAALVEALAAHAAAAADQAAGGTQS